MAQMTSDAEPASGPREGPASSEVERLLSFLYRTPFGIAECSPEGSVRMLNAMGAGLLQEIGARDGRTGVNNVIEVLATHDPALRELLGGPAGIGGVLCDGRQIHVSGAHGKRPIFVSLTAVRLDRDTLMFAFTDITRTVQAEQAAHAAALEQAMQASRLQTATSILQDIGNAVTGLRNTVVRMLGEPRWPELKQIKMLGDLLSEHREALGEVLGERRGDALIGFVQTLDEALRRRHEEYMDSVQSMTRAAAQIQETIDVQRKYLLESAAAEPEPLELQDAINIALSLAESSFDEHEITVQVSLPSSLPLLLVDRTQLVQVVLNLLRYAAEAFDDSPVGSERRIDVEARVEGKSISLIIRDDGVGIRREALRRLFEQGGSPRSSRVVMGFATTRAIVESQGGSLDLRLRPSGPGAELELRLPCIAS